MKIRDLHQYLIELFRGHLQIIRRALFARTSCRTLTPSRNEFHSKRINFESEEHSMKSKVMTLAFFGALAVGVMVPSAFASSSKSVAGNAHSQSATAVSQSKRLPPRLVSRTSSASRSPNSVNGKRK